MAILYAGFVGDPENLKVDDPACTAEIRPGDLWIPCELEPHGVGVQHEANVYGEKLTWSDSGYYWVTTVD